MDYNVTVELDGRPDADELSAKLFGSEPGDTYNLAVHSAPGGRVALTFTLEADYLEAAANLALTVTRGVFGLFPYAVTALPTQEFDRRAGLAPDPVQMISVPAAAGLLGVSQQRVRQLLDGGKLSGEKLGRDWMVSRASVEKRLSTSR